MPNLLSASSPVNHCARVPSPDVNAADWFTAVLTPATFAFVLLAELRFRRRFASVSWWLHYDSSDNDADTDEPLFHHYTLMNLGSESATNFSVVATTGVQTQGSAMSVIKSGENFPLTIRSQNFDTDWVLFTWVNADDRRYIRFQWFPLNRIGHLEEMRLEQAKKRRRHWWLWSTPQRVGPGAGAESTRVRIRDREPAETEKDMQTARSLLEVTRANPPQRYENGTVRGT